MADQEIEQQDFTEDIEEGDFQGNIENGEGEAEKDANGDADPNSQDSGAAEAPGRDDDR